MALHSLTATLDTHHAYTEVAPAADGGGTVANNVNHPSPSPNAGTDLSLQPPEEKGYFPAGLGKRKKTSGVWIHFKEACQPERK